MPIGIVWAAVMASTLRSIRLTTTLSFWNLKVARCSVWICEPDAASVFDPEVCRSDEVEVPVGREDRAAEHPLQVLRRVHHRLQTRRPNLLHSQPRKELVV